jgi:hypothetical protein
VRDVAVIDDVDALRERERRREVLLDQHDRLPGLRKLATRRHQVADDDRRKSLERLVEQDDLRIADQRAADREHLLFAARQIGAAAAAALLEAREHLVDAVERPPFLRGQPGEDQVLLDVERAEDAAILVHELHPCLRDLVAFAPGDLHAVELDRSGARRDDAHQALERRALAGAVAAEQRDDLVALDAKRNVEQDVRIAVVAVEPADVEQAGAGVRAQRLRRRFARGKGLCAGMFPPRSRLRRFATPGGGGTRRSGRPFASHCASTPWTPPR